ncbi:hypothetical protein PoB_003357400 [Plakobranchus ocellatus]|uniref:SOCS box domain-containing protein n=1 Tax=Plakobranchus ocellatus TaxID=259542 RepID=A0AAV4AHB2_9GAST|nr:hypothetical protein PoB_003357400 [Plakobranchus ocellatus]
MSQEADIPIDFESAIINNDVNVLQKLLMEVDVNMCLNWRHDSPLFLAVKLSREQVVQMLLLSPACDLRHVNANSYSALDLALVIAYDNQREPRQSACWAIVEMLLEAEAEPACPSAMLYVIRSALKLMDEAFLFRLISTLVAHCASVHMHQLLLCKLHRNQPLYSGKHGDELLEQASDFTVKVIKRHSDKPSLARVLACLPYFTDSHWTSRERRRAVILKVAVYLSILGWVWADLYGLAQISPTLANWCYRLPRTVPSLNHLCRLALLSGPLGRLYLGSEAHKLPKILRSYLNFTEVDALTPFSADFDFDSLYL